MQESTDISQNVFSDLKEILENLHQCPTIEEFLELDSELLKLQEYATFLKVYQNFNVNYDILNNSSQSEKDDLAINQFDTEIPEKFVEENLEFDRSDFESENVVSEQEDIVKNYDAVDENEILNDIHYSSLDFEAEDEIVLEQDDEVINNSSSTLQETDETLKTDLENVETNDNFLSSEEVEKLELKHQEERKFRLSNIKGVKKMETLFEDEFFENPVTTGEPPKTASLLKSNVSLDFMEADKAIPVFKLDLNDRIAFTKKLFSGSQADLNNAVTRLNDFATLDEAKEYLSELYYEKHWDKEDEFAQRLWNLVESKF